MGNGPTEEDAEIIQHDQLSTHSEDAEEVRSSGVGFLSFLPWVSPSLVSLRGLTPVFSLKNGNTNANDQPASGPLRAAPLFPVGPCSKLQVLPAQPAAVLFCCSAS